MAGAAYIKLTMNDVQANQAIDRTKNSLKSFAAAANSAGETLLLVSAPLATMINRFTRFSDTMLQIKAVSGATSGELAQMRNVASSLGRTTAFTSSQVAKGMVELSRMGFSAKEVVASIRPALNLVRATGEETWRLGEISEFAASVLRIFNLEASQFGRVADVMAMAANGSSVNITDLGMSLKTAGPIARSMGESLESTAAMLMTLADTGLRGTEAGTMLRRVFQSIAEQSGEGKKTADQLSKLGIKLRDAAGRARPVRDVFVDIGKAMRSMTQFEKIGFAIDVFDLRGSAAALNLSEFSKKLSEFEARLASASGYAAKAANEMESGFGGRIRMLKSALEELGNTWSDVWQKNLTPFVSGLTTAAKAVESFIKANKKFASSFTGMLLTVGLVAGGLKLVVATAKGVGAVFSPITAIIGYTFDVLTQKSKKAAQAEAEAAEKSRQVEAAERAKTLAVKRAAAVKEASIVRQAMREKKAALSTAEAVVVAEKRKLAAAQKRYDAEYANSEKSGLQQALDTNGVLGRGKYPELAPAAKALADQQKVVNAAIADAQKLSTQENKLHSQMRSRLAMARELSAAYKTASAEAMTAEQRKAEEQKKSDASRMVAETQRHLRVVQNARDEAQAVLEAEQQKLKSGNLYGYELAKQREVVAMQRQIVAERERDLIAANAAANAAAQKGISVEQMKDQFIREANAGRQLAEDQRHQKVMQNALAEAQAVMQSEQQKLAAAQQAAAGKASDSHLVQEMLLQQQQVAIQQQVVDARMRDVQAANNQVSASEKNVAAIGAETQAMASKMSTMDLTLAKQRAGLNFSLQSGQQLGAMDLYLMGTNKAYMLQRVATSAMELYTAAKAAGASGTRAAAYAVEATAAKIATGATTALKFALDLLCAHPVIAALTILAGIAAGIALHFANAAKKARELQIQSIKNAAKSRQDKTDDSNKELAKGDALRADSYKKAQRFYQLLEKQKYSRLSADEVREAEILSQALGDNLNANALGASVSGGRLSAKGGLGSLKKNMRAAAAKEVKDALWRINNELSQLEHSAVFDEDESGADARKARKEELLKRRRELRERQNQLDLDNEKGIFGSADFSADEKYQKELSQQKKLQESKLAKEKEIAKIEKEWHNRRISELDVELEKINEQYWKYKKQLETLIEIEKINMQQSGNPKERSAAEAKIARLKQKQAMLDQEFALRERDARDKAKAEESKYLGFESKLNRDVTQKVRESNLGRTLSKAQERGNYDVALQMARNEYNRIAAEMLKLRENYKTKLAEFRSATSDKGTGLSETEKKVLGRGQEKISSRAEKLLDLRNQILGIRDAMSNRQVTAFGSFSAREFNRQAQNPIYKISSTVLECRDKLDKIVTNTKGSDQKPVFGV